MPRQGSSRESPAGSTALGALPKVSERVVLQPPDLQRVVDALIRRGFWVVGPTVRGAAIVYDRVTSLEDLPRGWTDEQDGGSYRLRRRADGALFGFVVGPHSWKQFLHPPQLTLGTVRREGDAPWGGPAGEPPRYAFVGARSCELHAMAIQDKVLLQGSYADPHYGDRRQDLFLLAVNCTQPGGTCFCSSMNTGPRAASGFDLALTEICEESRHLLLIEVGTELGAEVLAEVPYRAASEETLQTAERMLARAAGQMGRTLETEGLRDLLCGSLEHPRWQEVATRCLACGNCTMVCPTCFCTTVGDTTDLTGHEMERWRTWDSCFSVDFSYIHGGSIRSSIKARYRQWMTHKLATWVDQFGMTGCVGCGRCITWCPVGIDITEEARAIREKGDAQHAAKRPDGGSDGD